MRVSTELRLEGALYMPTRTVTATTNIAVNDYTISVNNAAVAVTIRLPNPLTFANRVLVVKRHNSTSTGNITLLTFSVAGSLEMENSAGTRVDSFTMGTTATTRRYTFQSNGTFWELIGC
jgi:hypothetical protein